MVVIATCLGTLLALQGGPSEDVTESWLGRRLPTVQSVGSAWLGPGRLPLGVAEHRARVVVLSRWGSDSRGRLIDRLVRWHERRGVSVLHVVRGGTDEGVQGIVAELRRRGVEHPVLDDRRGRNAVRFGVVATPFAFLLNEDGITLLEGSPFEARFDREIRRLAAEPAQPTLDYDKHVRDLRHRLPHGGFSVVVQRPFVVIGDEARDVVKRRARGTVKWAVDLLREGYFRSQPDHIIDVWLFKNRASYNKHTVQLFGERPTTPYGFYSPSRRALIMNIATGGGTLCHEIVHPFVAANFPSCPSWLNEGLGSLYEQCQERDGKIRGLLNWRLPGIQTALRERRARTFAELCSTTDDQFYGDDQGVHYAQARYLCYYLQERGLLRGYYHAFVANQREDPTGYETLRRVLRRADMAEFERDWSRFVLDLER